MIGGWDVHTHLVPPAVVAAAEAGRYGMAAMSPDALRICGHSIALRPISDSSRLLARIAADELDGAVVSIPPPLFRPDLGRAERRDYAMLVNEALAEACAVAPTMLRPLAYLPAEEPELAAELASGLGEEWAGAVMGTELGDISYASPRLDPLWGVLSERRLALFIHPGASPDRRLDAFYLANLLGNPVETTIAAAHLLFGDVMGRFPRLTVVLAHGGGCLAALCGRWQRGVDTARPGIPVLPLSPLDAVRRFHVDSLFHSPAYRDAAIEILGGDRIVLGSDWPFPMGAPSAEYGLADLDPAMRGRIRTANCEGAFGRRLCR